jgi:hypothetical protein
MAILQFIFLLNYTSLFHLHASSAIVIGFFIYLLYLLYNQYVFIISLRSTAFRAWVACPKSYTGFWFGFKKAEPKTRFYFIQSF